MKCLILFLIVSISYTTTTIATSNSIVDKSSLQIIVVLSTSNGQEESSNKSVLNYWKQAEKILPAAELAANEVNNDSDILNDYVIKLLPIFVPDSDLNRGVVEFVKELLSASRNVVGVIGVFENRFANVILPLAGHAGIDVIQLVDPTAVNLDNSRLYPHTFTMHPSLAMHVRAASLMFQKLNWIRVGLVFSSVRYDSLYLRAAESFLSFINLIDVNINVVLIDIEQNDAINSTITKLQQSGVLAFLTLLPRQATAELIYAAQQQRLEYAWVLVDIGECNCTSNDTLYKYTNLNASVQLAQLVLIIRQTPCEPNCTFCDKLVTTNESVVDENPYSSVLYDSVRALSLALNTSLETLEERNLSLDNYRSGRNNITRVVEEKLNNLEFPGMKRSISIRTYAYRHTEKHLLEILQVQSGSDHRVGYFDSQTKNLTLNVTITIPGLGPMITYTYNIFPAALTIFLLILVGILLLLTTSILLGFIYYRNEPEVKSSSFRLSLCMFFGCYLMVFSVFCHFLSSGHAVIANDLRLLVCNIEQYLFSVGFDLLMTTLLAKLIRVWRIFTLHGKTSKFWSDHYVLLFIGLVVLLKIVLLVIWTVADIYELQDVEVLVSSDGINSHYMVLQQCDSEYYVAWLLIVYGYSIALGIAVIIVSMKTRKIKQENFKDTKKVSILSSTFIYIALVCGSLWAVLRLSGDNLASKVIIGMASCLVALLCEVFLFLPKLLPPLQRRFTVIDVVHKRIITSSGHSSSRPTNSTLNSSLYSV